MTGVAGEMRAQDSNEILYELGTTSGGLIRRRRLRE